MRIFEPCVIGTAAEHRDYHLADPGDVYIGDDTVIREFVTVNAGTIGPTRVGARCTLLRGSHVGHDAVIEDDVTLSCNVCVGGHAVVMRYANLGMGVLVHQGVVVPPLVMIGMGSVVTKRSEMRPFHVYAGNPVREIGLNHIGLERVGLSNQELDDLARAWRDRCASV